MDRAEPVLVARRPTGLGASFRIVPNPMRKPLLGTVAATTLGLFLSFLPEAQAQSGLGPMREREKVKEEVNKEAPQPRRLSQAGTQLRLVQFERGEHWAMRGLVLMSLGDDWHPSASKIILEALKSKDDRLRAYGLETLVRAAPSCLRTALSDELVEMLIRKTLKHKDPFVRERVVMVLKAAFPDATATKKSDWERHWYSVDKTFTPETWVAPPKIAGGKSVAGGAVERAMDLQEAGLDVVICIDSTGSMQMPIDSAAAAIDDLVEVLSSIAPKFRLGLVHYKDFGDLGEGGAVLEKLNKRHEVVRKRLEGLVASGGGDAPERVEVGLELALDRREMGWRRSTNKLVVVIGDAPPHMESIETAVDLAEQAFKRPFGQEASEIRARRRAGSNAAPTRPFVTACIGVGNASVGPATRSSFERISDAGGGKYGEIRTSDGTESTDALIAHMLRLSFGSQYTEHLDAFVEVFMDYQRRGLFK